MRTPGPWYIYRHQIKAEGEACYSIAQVTPQPREAEERANARLLAAAPEMLEALQDACSIITHALDAEGVPCAVAVCRDNIADLLRRLENNSA